MIKDEPEDDDMDFETMLNRELADVTGDRKSRRFRECPPFTPKMELNLSCQVYVGTRLLVVGLTELDLHLQCH